MHDAVKVALGIVLLAIAIALGGGFCADSPHHPSKAVDSGRTAERGGMAVARGDAPVPEAVRVHVGANDPDSSDRGSASSGGTNNEAASANQVSAEGLQLVVAHAENLRDGALRRRQALLENLDESDPEQLHKLGKLTKTVEKYQAMLRRIQSGQFRVSEAMPDMNARPGFTTVMVPTLSGDSQVFVSVELALADEPEVRNAHEFFEHQKAKAAHAAAFRFNSLPQAERKRLVRTWRTAKGSPVSFRLRHFPEGVVVDERTWVMSVPPRRPRR